MPGRPVSAPMMIAMNTSTPNGMSGLVTVLGHLRRLNPRALFRGTLSSRATRTAAIRVTAPPATAQTASDRSVMMTAAPGSSCQ